MFDKKKYYSYTNDIKFNIGLIYSIDTILATLVAISVLSYSIIISIISIIIGILIANLQTKWLEIKLQEMYWRLDTYDKINNQPKNN